MQDPDEKETDEQEQQPEAEADEETDELARYRAAWSLLMLD